MEQVSESKWEAKVSARLEHASAGQIWPLLEDFFGLYKWFPSLSTSYGIHGRNGEIGSIRYCAGFAIPAQGSKDHGQMLVSWSKERIIAIDHVEKSLSYEIVDSNLGFNSYVSTMKASNGDPNGCIIEMSISLDPVEGWIFENLVKSMKMDCRAWLRKWRMP